MEEIFQAVTDEVGLRNGKGGEVSTLTWTGKMTSSVDHGELYIYNVNTRATTEKSYSKKYTQIYYR